MSMKNNICSVLEYGVEVQLPSNFVFSALRDKMRGLMHAKVKQMKKQQQQQNYFVLEIAERKRERGERWREREGKTEKERGGGEERERGKERKRGRMLKAPPLISLDLHLMVLCPHQLLYYCLEPKIGGMVPRTKACPHQLLY